MRSDDNHAWVVVLSDTPTEYTYDHIDLLISEVIKCDHVRIQRVRTDDTRAVEGARVTHVFIHPNQMNRVSREMRDCLWSTGIQLNRVSTPGWRDMHRLIAPCLDLAACESALNRYTDPVIREIYWNRIFFLKETETL